MRSLPPLPPHTATAPVAGGGRFSLPRFTCGSRRCFVRSECNVVIEQNLVTHQSLASLQLPADPNPSNSPFATTPEERFYWDNLHFPPAGLDLDAELGVHHRNWDISPQKMRCLQFQQNLNDEPVNLSMALLQVKTGGLWGGDGCWHGG